MRPTTEWVSSRDAADHLGISERTLHRWRASQLLRPGRDFCRKFPTSTNSPLLYDLGAVERAMREASRRSPGLLEVVA